MSFKMRKISFIFILCLCSAMFVLGLSSCKKDKPTDEPGQVEPNVEYFTVTIDLADGSNPTTKQVEKNKTLTGIADPSKENYTFKGWKANGVDWTMDTPITGDITIVAQWEKNPDQPGKEYFTVTVDFDNGASIFTKEVEKGEKLTGVETPVKINHIFKGWKANGVDWTMDTPITGDITIVAQWEKEEEPIVYHTVTLDANGGVMSGETRVQVAEGSTMSAPNSPIKIGEEFIAWQLNNKNFNFSTPITQDITLKAFYDIDPKKYTVSFNSVDGSIVESVTGLKRNETCPAPENPTKLGYDFAGWYLDGKLYDFSTPVAKNITLVASWTKAKVTVSFNAGEGASTIPNQVIEAGTKAINPGAPTKADARFLGWYLDDKPYDFSQAVQSSITLVAKWENTYTLTFLNPTASYTWQQVITIKVKENTSLGVDFANAQFESDKVELSDLLSPDAGFSHNGYFVWVGWVIDGTDTPFDPTDPVTGSMTISAKWEENYYVNFSNSDEEEIVVPKGMTVRAYFEKLGKEIPAPSDSYGHPFDLWSYSGEPFDFDLPIVQNTILTARYKYYVTFETLGGSEVTQQEIGYGKYAEKPSVPTKEHYHFIDWYHSGSPFIFDANAITEDTVLTARWVYVFNGKGTKEEPYLLSVKSDIENLHDLINKNSQDPITGLIYSEAYFKLTTDISMDAVMLAPIAHFMGDFDGAGHSILDFKLTTANNANVGFFQELESPAKVYNVKLLDVEISGTHAANASIGLLAGKTDQATVYGVEVSGQITLSADRMERAVIGGLIGEAIQTSVYGTVVDVHIMGGNVVGGLVGYAKNESVLSTSYIQETSKLQLYRTGYLGGLAGNVDETSIISDSLTLAQLMDSNYTISADSKKNAFGFGDGKFINCHFESADKKSVGWNTVDWNEDLTLKVIPQSHEQIHVSLGSMKNDSYVEQENYSIDYGTKLEDLPVIEGESGQVFIGYQVNGLDFDMAVPLYSDIRLVAVYGSYESMLGKWGGTEDEWFNLKIDSESKTISAEASIFTDTYATTGSNFTTIPLYYEKSDYEMLPYVEFDSYGYFSLTGDFYEGVVIYLKRRTIVVGAKEEEYRVYLQRVNSGDYDKAFMRLERKEDSGWTLINDLMYPQASDYSGYYVNDQDDIFFIKAPFIPNYNNYNQPLKYTGTYMNSSISYTPFIFIGVEGYDDYVLGITTGSSSVIADYVVSESGHLKEIYNYESNQVTNVDYVESFDFMNGRWFNEDGAYSSVNEDKVQLNPKDPYYVYENLIDLNHTITINSDAQTITIDGTTYPYTKSKNEEGVDVLSYQEGTKTHLLWGDYSTSTYSGIDYFLKHQCIEENKDTITESWVNYSLAMKYYWVEDQPEENEPDLGFGDIVIDEMTIKYANYDPVPYEFVILTDCDGIPGMEVLSLTYIRFIVDGKTYFVREYTSVGFLQLYYEDPANPGHILSKRYKSRDSFKYDHDAYKGEWISKDQTDSFSVDIQEKKINGFDFEFGWYVPNDYDYEVFGVNARFYKRVASFTDGVDQYQFRTTFVRDGYGYLFKYDSEKQYYVLVKEYFNRSYLDLLLGSWNYYETTKTDVIDVEFDGTYQVYFNGTLQKAFLTWNGYNGVPVIAFKYDNGEKVELLHLVSANAYGYELMDVLDYDSYEAVYDEAEEDMVYEYTSKYLYFKDTTIAEVVSTMSGTWTDGSITVTIKSDEILVIEPDCEPVTLSIAYIYDLPSAFMDQYVVMMVGVDDSGAGNYLIYYYNYYLYYTHLIDDEHYTSGVLTARDDVMSFRGNFISISLEETHTFYFDGSTLKIDDHEYDVANISYGYAMLNDGRIVPAISFDDVLELDEKNLTAIIRACQIYYIDGVMVVSITDSHVTLSVSTAGVSIESYDKIDKILVNELFYSVDILQYNGVYHFNGTSSFVLNDGYTYVDGEKIDADILVLNSGNIQVIFKVGNEQYYAVIGINAYGERVYSIFKMSLAS